MRRTLVILILALAATAVIATAAKAYAEESGPDVFYTGNVLLERCGSEEDAFYLFCTGYVAGIADHISSDKSIFPNVSSGQYWIFNDVCSPENVTVGQLAKVWIKWANEHPERLHLAASSLVTEAFAQAWPCP